MLSPAEVAHALRLGWDFVEAASGSGVRVSTPASDVYMRKTLRRLIGLSLTDCLCLQRGDPSSWRVANWPANWSQAGSNHSAAMWFVRAAPGVRQAWAALVGSDDLIVSYDQLGMYPLPEGDSQGSYGGSLAGASGAWYHTDQSPAFRGAEGVEQETQGSHGLHRDYGKLTRNPRFCW